MRKVLFATLTALVLCVTTVTTAEQIRVIGFNVEAGWKSEADLGTIARQVKDLSPADSLVDLWGFSEVTAKHWPERLKRAAGQNFRMVLGKKSNDDRLLAVYNADKFTLEESFELEHLQGGWGGRAPLVLRLNRTGTRFLFVVNHLLRDEKKRRQHTALTFGQTS